MEPSNASEVGPGGVPGQIVRRVLIIEDDEDLMALARLHLEEAGYHVDSASDGIAGCAAIDAGEFDLVVLDLGLPGVDGLDLCRRVRSKSGYVPVIILTARGAELDRVVGLELGADDYLVKPVSLREFVARVRALFRRSERMLGADSDGRLSDAEPAAVLELGALVLDTERRRVRVAQRPVELTAKEFDLLAHFLRHPGRVFTRAELLDAVWGSAFSGYEHTVNSHINRLRTKLGPAKDVVETVWGVGYRMAEDVR